MFDVIRAAPRRAGLVFGLVGLVGLVYLLGVVALTLDTNGGQLDAPLDDTWIHVRFADHVAHGQGLTYNDELTMGATSPLWIMVLASAFTIAQPDVMAQVDVAVALSAAGFLLSGWAITGFGWWLTRRAWVGLVAGLITVLTGRFVWMGLSGMEITTFTALTIFALWSHAHDLRTGRPFGWRTGILCALATLARPEAYLLTALIGASAFIFQPLRDFRHQNGLDWPAIRQHIQAGWRGGLAYLLLAGSYPLVSLLVSGHPLPNTFRAKSQLGREWPDLPHAFLWATNNEHGPLLIGLAAVGLLAALWLGRRSRSASPLWALWPVFFVLAVLLMGAQRFVVNNSRYVAPSIPWHALLASFGLAVLYDLGQTRLAWLRTARWGHWLPLGAGLLLAGLVLGRGYGNATGVARNVQQFRQMHVAAGLWIQEAAPPDATIALNDVGAMVHISDRRVLDLEGLVSPEVIAATRDTPDESCPHDLQLARLMLEQRPFLIGVFPWFYPCLTGWEGALQAETVFSITGTTVIAGGEMVFYWPVWEEWPVQAAVPQEAVPVEARFQQGINLAAYQTTVQDDGLQVTLWWHSSGQPAADYHVFVHVLDADGELVAQHDGQPQGRFATSWWRDGDIIRDPHPIIFNDPDWQTALAAGDYRLQVGLYRLADGARLPRSEAEADYPDRVVLPLLLLDNTPARLFG